MDIVIGFDVGGTNSRASIAGLLENGTLSHDGDFPRVVNDKVASKEQLGRFIGQVLDSLTAGDRVVSAVVALAGPVIGHREVTMTNWPAPKEITVEEFVSWGLPAGQTTLINDMEAGCYGLIKCLGEDKTGAGCFEYLGDDDQFATVPDGNHIFIAPGTGLGAAGILEIANTSGTAPLMYPISAEVQHTPMPALNEEHGAVVDWWRRQGRTAPPSWDDIVSGRGLVSIYQALRAFAGDDKPDITIGADDGAAAVAKAAASGQDATAKRALSVFYDCIGRFCQLMALSYQAFGGVFIGGASTSKNWDFIKNHPDNILQSFLDNPSQQSLLARIPVYLVKADDLNLDGILWLGMNTER